MAVKKTVIIVPPNDAEAVMIRTLADKLSLPVIESKQLHGASLDQGRDYVSEVVQGGFRRVIVVEMPGPRAEARLRRKGIDVKIIDHHHYAGLSRAHDARGRLLPSSLEQFLAMFKVTDARLKRWGFDPKLVRGIGIQDRGYVWALQEEGYSKKEIQQVMDFHDSLISHLRHPKSEARKARVVAAAWKRRKKWREFWIMSTTADVQLRPGLSRLVVQKIGKPTPMIILEHGRGIIYVQESSYALQLIERLGGFTFGRDRNWGYKNEQRKPRVTLKDVKRAIDVLQSNNG
jgi:hypothetical protein